MKIFVRVMAEAETENLRAKDLIHIENVFTKDIAEAIVRKLAWYSPYDRRMEALPQKKFKDTKGAAQRQVWTKGRMEKTRHLQDEWAQAAGSMGGRTIYNRMPYAYFLAKGTGIYGPRGAPITPREKKAMSFYYSFIRKWVVTRQVRGINPARFQKEVIDRSQREGTIIGVRRAIAELEKSWRGTLRAKLILL